MKRRDKKRNTVRIEEIEDRKEGRYNRSKTWSKDNRKSSKLNRKRFKKDIQEFL